MGRIALIIAWLLMSITSASAQDAEESPVAKRLPMGKPHVCSPQDWYPRKALGSLRNGAASVCFHIEPDGSVRDVIILDSSGHEDFDRAAIECVSTWRYEPTAPDEPAIEMDWSAQVAWCIKGGVSNVPTRLKDTSCHDAITETVKQHTVAERRLACEKLLASSHQAK